MSDFAKLPAMPDVPQTIYTGEWTTGHIQGIAVDPVKRFIYYSFTTVLVKADFEGNTVGFVKGLTGHLGCISFNAEDGKVYGSIEYKHDSIGQGIMKRTGIQLAEEDAFYCAVFDVDKIDRPDLDAEKDGIMTAVYLPDVVEDFMGKGENGKDHRYACSGIDGTGFGPDFGAPKDSPKYLFIAYGIYTDNERADNDNQVILKLDWRKFAAVAKPLCQGEPHHEGLRCEQKYFVYTGSTNWGIQNLEYDAFTDSYLAAVYLGKKPEYRNPPMFLIDQTAAPVEQEIHGVPGEKAPHLTLKKVGVQDEAHDLWGCDFHVGTTGIYSFGNGYYYFSYESRRKDDEGRSFFRSNIQLVKYTGLEPELFDLANTFLSSDGETKVVYRLWRPKGEIRGIVQISHGMMEHIGRYDTFAKYLCSLGYAVAGNDHLGHGKTSPKEEDRGYFAPYGGHLYLVEDLHTLTGILHDQYPDTPLFLLGHSMGSFVARLYLASFAEDVDGAILMGTAGPGAPVGLGMFVAGLIAAFRGERHRSKLITKLAFGSYNKKWEKPCSEYAWLSKDKESVEAYEADPDCHFMFTCSAYRDLFNMLSLINNDEWAKQIPTDTPILMVSGGDDPVGGYGKGVKKVAGMLANHGAKKLTVKLFPTDRHEVLGETDRDKVYAFLSEWLDGVLAEIAEQKASDVPEE